MPVLILAEDPNDGLIPVQVDANGYLQTDVLTVSLPSTVYNGQKTVTTNGTAEALASSQALSAGVLIKALADNTNDVYVGDSSVDSSNGFVLAAGEEVFIEIDNLASVYIDVDTNGEGVSYIGS